MIILICTINCLFFYKSRSTRKISKKAKEIAQYMGKKFEDYIIFPVGSNISQDVV
ncbi:MAG: hypothetical protein BAJALOKI1v1_120037 [Promethearchaeota archaeon]|nr:MAG: hypothetical protein BAJALOKI1v1_120037 [Candidatus Lokiarchaeota archaeon]